MYINFKDLIELSQNWPVKLDWSFAHEHIRGLRLGGKAYPVSITGVEANFMKDHIIERGYKNAFELATGVGISSLAIGLGMKETGGQFITCDNYSEEAIQEVPFGTREVEWTNAPDGYVMFQTLKEHFDLPGIQVNKSSPQIYSELNGGLDFVFLDCPKDDNDLKRDIDGIFPLLEERCTIMLHDSHCFTEKGESYFSEKFGRPYDKIYQFGDVRQFFPLAVFVRG